MSLKEYQKKRDFKKTAEPKGRVKHEHEHLFIIQKHAASHLHYDFRIELNGVLLSWAIPKGPCLDPKVKRLAVHVEDHPVEYGFFEGIIPKGEYGGGSVTLWDKGIWIPLDKNPSKAYKEGHLRFELNAHKLQGRWDLFRFKEDKHWLLVKYDDEYAKPLADYDVTEFEPLSVITEQTIDEIKNHYEQVWAQKDSTGRVKTEVKKNTKKPTNNIKPAVEFTITHSEKIVYPEDRYTKQDVLDYYNFVCDYMLPFIENRPLSLVRCPENYKKCFFQRHFNKTTPKALKAIDIESKGIIEPYIYLDDREGLLSIVQMGALEIHSWGSTITTLERPDIIIIDLDPAPDVTWKEVVVAALDIKTELNQLHLKAFLKTTGGKGLHVVIPILPEYEWDEVKRFTHLFAQYLEMKKPNQYISKMTKAQRGGKIFIDYLRNQRSASAIAVYSTRSRIHAPVSVPLEWEELTNRSTDTTYTIKTLPKRLQTLKKDPWQDFFKIKQSLPLFNLD